MGGIEAAAAPESFKGSQLVACYWPSVESEGFFPLFVEPLERFVDPLNKFSQA